MAADRPVPESLVLSRPDRLGDVVISSTVFAPLRHRFADARIHLLAAPAWAPLFASHPLLDGFIPLPEDDGEAALAGTFRALAVDTIVHLHGHPVVEAAAVSAGVGHRIGFAGNGAGTLTHALPDRKKRGEKHEALHGFDLLAMLGVAPPERLEASLSPDPAARAAVEELGLGARYAVFHLAAFGDKPRVPAPLFGAVARELLEHRSLEPVVVGGTPEPAALAEFNGALGPHAARTRDLCGRLNVAETAWVLAGARVTLSRDSGPAHLAAALGCPTVTIFAEPNRVNSSQRWHPIGPRARVIERRTPRWWWESRKRFGARALRHVTPAMVVAEVGAVLDGPGDQTGC